MSNQTNSGALDTFGGNDGSSGGSGSDSSTSRRARSAKILQPYLDAAATCQNVAAMRAVVSKVLQDPELFAGYDQIKSVLQQASMSTAGGTTAGSDEKKEVNAGEETIYRTLDLYSYGTFHEYHHQQQTAPGHFLSLTDSQITKLRQLTVLTLIENAGVNKQDRVAYSAIYKAIHPPDSPAAAADANDTNSASEEQQQQQQQQPKLLLQQWREIEFVLAQLLGARLFTGKLSQKNAALMLCNPSSIRDSSEGGALMSCRDVHSSTVSDFMLPTLRALGAKLVESNGRIRKQQAHLLHAQREEKEAIQRQANVMAVDASFDNRSAGGNVANAMAAAAAAEGGDILGPMMYSLLGQRPKRSRGGLVGNN